MNYKREDPNTIQLNSTDRLLNQQYTDRGYNTKQDTNRKGQKSTATFTSADYKKILKRNKVKFLFSFMQLKPNFINKTSITYNLNQLTFGLSSHLKNKHYTHVKRF